jgi:hypothetical protein
MNPEEIASESTSASVRVLVCRVGAAPVVEVLASNEQGQHIDAMQALVGGFVTVISLEDGVELWCNDDAILLGLPLNRVISAIAPPIPSGFENAVIIRLGNDLALPGEPGEWRIYGDFFLARSTTDGQLADVTDADVAQYLQRWPAAS